MHIVLRRSCAPPAGRSHRLSPSLALTCAVLLLFAGSASAAPPTVAVTSPAVGATVSGAIALGVNASDDVAVLQVKWYVDGREVWWDGWAPWSGSWNSTSVPDGQHSVFAKAMDATGTWGTSPTVSFTVANTAPPASPSGALTLAVTNPGAGGAVVSGTVPLSVATSSDTRARQMKWVIDGGEVYWDGISPWSGIWNSASVIDGTHTMFAKALDGSTGQWVSSPTVSFTVKNGVTAPTPTGWKLMMSDDFDSSTLDLTKWFVYGPNWPGHNGNGIRDGRAVSIQNGVLTITAQMLNGTLYSGAIAARLNMPYGRYEFRARTDVDPSKVMSGVVLTWPETNNFPIEGENDIYETLWNGTRSPFYSFIHYGSTNQQYYFVHNADGAQWQEMAMEWDPYAIRIFRNGSLVWTLTDRNAIPDVAHHLCIQLDAFGTYISGPVRLQVDNVRIYARA